MKVEFFSPVDIRKEIRATGARWQPYSRFESLFDPRRGEMVETKVGFHKRFNSGWDLVARRIFGRLGEKRISILGIVIEW